MTPDRRVRSSPTLSLLTIHTLINILREVRYARQRAQAQSPQQQPLYLAALEQLRTLGEAGDPTSGLYLLDLALWGLEQGVPVPPLDQGQRANLELEVGQLLSWDPQIFLEWLVNNPAGPSAEEQTADILAAIEGAETPNRAAQRLLEEIASNLAQWDP